MSLTPPLPLVTKRHHFQTPPLPSDDELISERPLIQKCVLRFCSCLVYIMQLRPCSATEGPRGKMSVKGPLPPRFKSFQTKKRLTF